MLDFWIIEKIREKKKEAENRPVLRLPVPEDYPCQPTEEELKSTPRGVIKINIGGNDDEE